MLRMVGLMLAWVWAVINVAYAETATFAGGRFEFMQPPFDKLAGVMYTTVGYAGGTVENPTREQVAAGETGHVEAVRVVYDPNQISYEKLLDVYWHNIDPFSQNRQFCDAGLQYRAIIFYESQAQKQAAERSKAAMQFRFNEPVVVAILPDRTFYAAELSRQEYYRKRAYYYNYARKKCKRDERLEEVWG